MDAEITAAEAAELLGVSSAQIRWYHGQGLLPGRRIGARMLVFHREDVEKFDKPKKTGRPKTTRKEQKSAAAPKKGRPATKADAVPAPAAAKTRGKKGKPKGKVQP